MSAGVSNQQCHQMFVFSVNSACSCFIFKLFFDSAREFSKHSAAQLKCLRSEGALFRYSTSKITRILRCFACYSRSVEKLKQKIKLKNPLIQLHRSNFVFQLFRRSSANLELNWWVNYMTASNWEFFLFTSNVTKAPNIFIVFTLASGWLEVAKSFETLPKRKSTV